jgi:hypothetical protein
LISPRRERGVVLHGEREWIGGGMPWAISLQHRRILNATLARFEDEALECLPLLLALFHPALLFFFFPVAVEFTRPSLSMRRSLAGTLQLILGMH